MYWFVRPSVRTDKSEAGRKWWKTLSEAACAAFPVRPLEGDARPVVNAQLSDRSLRIAAANAVENLKRQFSGMVTGLGLAALCKVAGSHSRPPAFLWMARRILTNRLR